MTNRLKEQIISDLVELRESRDIIQEESERLQDKMKRLSRQNKSLLQRVKRLACRVESRSPLISEAEECMMKEVEGVRDHIKTMTLEILTVSVGSCVVVVPPLPSSRSPSHPPTHPPFTPLCFLCRTREN